MSEVSVPIVDEFNPSFLLDIGEDGEEVVTFDTKAGLSLSTNSKTSQIVGNRNDGRANHYPHFPNSFGLPSFQSCPGHTEEFCRPFCYGVNAEGRTNVRNNLRRNLEVLRGKTEGEMTDLLRAMMADYQSQFDRYVEKGRIDPGNNIFRIHWDGDFFNLEYANAWRRVIEETPQIEYWTYTRSFRDPVDVVPIFLEGERLRNLAFYISVDKGNREEARRQANIYGQRLLMAFCGETLGEAVSLAHDLGRKHLTPCPENIGELPLSINGHGACVECGLCIKNRPNILFVHENNPPEHPQLGMLFEGVPIRLSEKRKSTPGFDASLLGKQSLDATVAIESQIV